MREKRYHIALATTLGAVLLWGSVKLGGQYQNTVLVPVLLSDIPPAMALAAPIPRFIELSVRGEGWQMAGHLWNTHLRVEIDPASAVHGARIVTLRDIMRDMALPENIELTDMKPESLVVVLDTYAEKKVPLTLENRASFAEGYGLSGPPLLTPDSITVAGAARVVQPVDSWYVVTTELEGLRSPVTQEIPVADSAAYLLMFSPSTVTLALNVQPLAEKTLSGIAVTVHSVPPDREVILIPPRIDILVRGAIDLLPRITAADCRVSVSFQQTEGDTVRTVAPSIDLPAGLTVIGRTPERLQFVIRQRLQ